MPTTSRRSRGPSQKACIGCAKSKRRCDQKRPECQRCLDRDINCIYPSPRKRQKGLSLVTSHAEGYTAFQNHAETSLLDGDLNLDDWGMPGSADLDLDLGLDLELPDMIISHNPAIPTPLSSQSVGEIGLLNESIPETTCPWFLQGETWAMRHCTSEQNNVVLRMESFIRSVDEILRNWIKNGYNCFIHHQLYEKGMPTCVQDAFSTLATYIGLTPAVKETVLQIVDDRMSDLVRKEISPFSCDSQGILAQLSRVQALFIYEFIGLFDGSVRLRASAEKYLPTLRQWVIQMWEVVRMYRGEDFSLGQRSLDWTATEFDKEYNDSTELWQLWILTESVRRTHILVDSVANTYETMTKGLVDCTGAVMFTARRGLWEAESAVKWFKLCCQKSPLLVPSLEPGPLISQYPADEVDDFAKFYWTYLVGTDKIQCWIDKSQTN